MSVSIKTRFVHFGGYDGVHRALKIDLGNSPKPLRSRLTSHKKNIKNNSDYSENNRSGG